MPHYFVPNFIRPVPEADEDPEVVEGEELEDYDISADALY